METPRYRGSLVMPVVLIGLGAILLLNNLGVVSWDVWQTIVRLWPVLLIAIGLDIMFGRHSAAAAVLVPLAVLGVVGLGIWAAWTQAPGAGHWEHKLVRESAPGARQADVEIGFGAGTLEIGAMDEVDFLIRGTIALASNEDVTRELRLSGDTAVFRLQDHRVNVAPFINDRAGQRLWDLDLVRDLPMRLRLENGVGSSRLDLTELTLTDLVVKTGVGEVNLTLPETGDFAARVEGGIGEVTVTVPRGMAARVRLHGGMGKVGVSGGAELRDGVYLTPGYDTAAHRVDLDVKGGIGEIWVHLP